jgi:hypothetical protein
VSSLPLPPSAGQGSAEYTNAFSSQTVVDAAFGEVLTTCEKLRWTIANGEDQLKTEPRTTNLILAHKVSEVRYEPLGVVAAIVSWNYAFHNAFAHHRLPLHRQRHRLESQRERRMGITSLHSRRQELSVSTSLHFYQSYADFGNPDDQRGLRRVARARSDRHLPP